MSTNLIEVHDKFRAYQKTVCSTLVEWKRGLNYMPMGMGKTLVTLHAVMTQQAWPCIIVCSKSAMYVWEEELKKWYAEPSSIYVGKPKQREAVWKDFVESGRKFIITNFRLVGELTDLAGYNPKGSRGSGTKGSRTPPTTLVRLGGRDEPYRFRGLVADEIQLGGLFNHKSLTYGVFERIAKEIPHVYLLTGTPFRKGVIDFFGPLHLINPEEFKNYWAYRKKWCLELNNGFGVELERTPRDVPAFRAMLRKYAIILNKEEHLKELPGKIRQAIPIEMGDEQARVYRDLHEQLYAEIQATGGFLFSPGVLSLSTRLRQLLVCPQELGLKDRGAAIDTLIEMAGDLVENGKPFVVFTAFKKAVPYIKRELLEEFDELRVFEITGGLTPEQFRDQWQGFQNSNHRQRVLICVIKSAASFHATTADTCFFLGPEWDINQNEQAEDRLNRIGQKSMVTCYYIKHRGTVDEAVIEKLNSKKYAANLVLSDEEQFKEIWGKVTRS